MDVFLYSYNVSGPTGKTSFAGATTVVGCSFSDSDVLPPIKSSTSFTMQLTVSPSAFGAMAAGSSMRYSICICLFILFIYLFYFFILFIDE